MIKIKGYAFTDEGPLKFNDKAEVKDKNDFDKLIKDLNIKHYLVILEEV